MSLARTLRRAAERKERKLARKAEKANQTSIPNNMKDTTKENEQTNMNNTNPPEPENTVSNKDEAPPSSKPVSAARLAANRANAKHSTGPTSSTGLAASSQNRTSHGLARHANGIFDLLLCEDAAEFAALSGALEKEHQPTTATEVILVRGMAQSQWLAERAQNLLNTCIDPTFGKIKDPKMFSLYLRYQTTHKRAFHKSLNDLQKLRAEARKAEIGFEAQKIKVTAEKRKSDVHQIDILVKSMAADIEIGKFTTLRIKANRENPDFDAQFQAEKVKRAAAA